MQDRGEVTSPRSLSKTLELQLCQVIVGAVRMDASSRDSPGMAGTGEAGCPFSDLNSIFMKHLLRAKPRDGHFHQHYQCLLAIKLGK